MAKTLITRIKNDGQYDTTKRTVLWKDATIKRWSTLYNKLEINDNIIFIGAEDLKGKILFCKISEINDKISLQCGNVIEKNCKNDDLLRVSAIFPELIPQVKALFKPFIHSKEIDINDVINSIENHNFINFYIINSESEYNKIRGNFNVNDRILIKDSNGKMEDVKLHTEAGLINFPESLDIKTSVIGLNLEQIKEINESIKRKSIKSNNLERINDIKKDLNDNGYFKFTSFFTYHDTLYNKLVYKNRKNLKVNITIPLGKEDKVFKVSMSHRSLDDEAYSYFMENNLIVVHKDTNAMATSSQTQGDDFANLMGINDYFYLCRGNRNLELIGKVTSNSTPCELDQFGETGWLQRSFEIVSEVTKEGSYEDASKWWTPNFNSTLIAIPRNEIALANDVIFKPFFNTEFIINKAQTNSNSKLDKENKPPMELPLNNILYGPPGTGKTYNTINKAIKIVKPNFDLNQNRKTIKEEFNRLVKDGQIVFTTFHQSMGYEDFIEGIKPIEPENEGDPVIYKIQLGIFRKLCIEASFAIARLREDKTTEDVLDFSALYDKLVEDIEEKLLTGKKTELKTRNGGSVLVENISQQRNITIKHHDGTRIYTVSKARLSKLNSEIKNLDEVNNINTEFKSIIGGSNSSAYWSVLNAIRKMKPITKIGNVNYDFEEKKEVVGSLTKLDYKNAKKAPFVLIIDEINRGNVSQIFGELITLIEEDKRLGKEEALEITLPYSKETFGVPPNLYIIGTMNTADRSVEALDTALRRRFSFEEMLPKYDLDETKFKIEGYAVNDILKTINNRIEKLLDKDHLIGHSYFMNIQTVEELEVVFKNKVIPLLQEYFYGDYGKIGLVIGNGFVRKIEWNGDNLFADFDYENKSDFDDREVFELHYDDFKNALKLLMEKKQK